MNDTPTFVITSDAQTHNSSHGLRIAFDIHEWKFSEDAYALLEDLNRDMDLASFVGMPHNQQTTAQISWKVSDLLMKYVQTGSIFFHSTQGKWHSLQGNRLRLAAALHEYNANKVLPEKIGTAGPLYIYVKASGEGVILKGLEDENLDWAETKELYKILGDELAKRGRLP